MSMRFSTSLSFKMFLPLMLIFFLMLDINCDVKRVKTNSQKVLGANSYVCRSYRGKTSRGGLFVALILNRVNPSPSNCFLSSGDFTKHIKIYIQTFAFSLWSVFGKGLTGTPHKHLRWRALQQQLTAFSC